MEDAKIQRWACVPGLHSGTPPSHIPGILGTQECKFYTGMWECRAQTNRSTNFAFLSRNLCIIPILVYEYVWLKQAQCMTKARRRRNIFSQLQMANKDSPVSLIKMIYIVQCSDRDSLFCPPLLPPPLCNWQADLLTVCRLVTLVCHVGLGLKGGLHGD